MIDTRQREDINLRRAITRDGKEKYMYKIYARHATKPASMDVDDDNRSTHRDETSEMEREREREWKSMKL